ncbi:MAG TPA: metallophosphoesterase family protein [Candidatus Polarisedimenticolaceae bacterium]|nr:metallophosphoesterase family protein [Candidatus Polarisedimenticolaceae bacterium]
MSAPTRLGLISDTHGLLRPEALELLRGVDHIVHAGDVGDPTILEALGVIAPVTAVRGNVDRERWAEALPETEMIELGGLTVYVLHDLGRLTIDPGAAGVGLVVSGHSHKPLIEQRRGVLYVNPGSAGPRRFKLPITLGEVVITRGAPSARLVELCA